MADEEGLELMVRAGLPIDEAIPAFEALAENAVYGAGDPRKMWSSHPKLEDRIDNLEKEIKRAKRKKDIYRTVALPDELIYYRGIAPALLINARLDIQERQFGRAREALQKYLAVHPDDPEAHFLLGETHRRSNPQGPDFTSSQSAYQAALKLDTAYAPALKVLGMTSRIQRHDAPRARRLRSTSSSPGRSGCRHHSLLPGGSAMRRLSAGVLAFALVASAYAASDDEAFMVDKRDFKKTYKVIALMPRRCGTPYLEMSDAVAAMLEEEVTALQKRGYTVLPSSVLAGILGVAQQVGGIVDS